MSLSFIFFLEFFSNGQKNPALIVKPIVYFVFFCVVFILRTTRPAFIKQQQRENGQLVVSYVDA